MPKPLLYLWGVYCRLARRRGFTQFGALPITWLDIDAFQRVTGFRLSRWEVEIIELLDDLSLAPREKPVSSTED